MNLLLTPGYIDSIIVKVDYVRPVEPVIICILKLENGLYVTGEYNCINPDNYNEEAGRQIAYDNAKSKLWSFESYLLGQRIHELTAT